MNQTKALSIRISLILLSGIVIWHFTAYLSTTLMGEEYSALKRLFSALVTTVLTLLLLQAALKIDQHSWLQLGQSTAKTNIYFFLLGFFSLGHSRFIGRISLFDAWMGGGRVFLSGKAFSSQCVPFICNSVFHRGVT